jgi:hypothetical protein
VAGEELPPEVNNIVKGILKQDGEIGPLIEEIDKIMEMEIASGKVKIRVEIGKRYNVSQEESLKIANLLLKTRLPLRIKGWRELFGEEGEWMARYHNQGGEGCLYWCPSWGSPFGCPLGKKGCGATPCIVPFRKL